MINLRFSKYDKSSCSLSKLLDHNLIYGHSNKITRYNQISYNYIVFI